MASASYQPNNETAMDISYRYARLKKPSGKHSYHFHLAGSQRSGTLNVRALGKPVFVVVAREIIGSIVASR
jgi:hypothetical protein